MLDRSPVMAAHADSLEQLVWLHLRLLVAQAAIGRVVRTARDEHKQLEAHEQLIDARLGQADLVEELRRSLEQQKSVIDQRQAAHLDAARREEHVDSELERITQQVALLREQALLATDEGGIGLSLDALAASFREANRWLDGQRDLLGSFDLDLQPRLPQHVLRGNNPGSDPQSNPRSAMTEGESS
jgi:Tfp pilus assembly protein PilN